MSFVEYTVLILVSFFVALVDISGFMRMHVRVCVQEQTAVLVCPYATWLDWNS